MKTEFLRKFSKDIDKIGDKRVLISLARHLFSKACHRIAMAGFFIANLLVCVIT